MRLVLALCLACLAWAGITPAATVPPPAFFGTWVITAQTCPSCTGITVAPDLAGATLVVSASQYSDAVIGTDVCPGAPVFSAMGKGTLASVLAQAPVIDANRLSALLPPSDAVALRLSVACSVPALPPYAGKVLAHLVFIPPAALLRVWEDNVLLFRRAPRG